MTLAWNALDDRAVRNAKVLTADAVEKVGNGHPGAAISLAPAAYLLYQRIMSIDPSDDRWLGRDRFVLSAGHASLLQYLQLYFAGAGIELDDLKKLRTLGARTPGHPEFRHTPGVELTTGPLGTGFASAVGFAMSARYIHGLLDPKTPDGESIFDHFVYTLVGDGCLQEGVSAEASSLAGTLKLGNLIALYDDNHISIEDDTNISFNEDVLARYEAYGWDVHRVTWLAEDGSYTENINELYEAIKSAKADKSRPSLIALRTIIGWPTPGKKNTGDIHGAKLGSEALRELKKAVGYNPDSYFDVDEEALAHTRTCAAKRGCKLRNEWNARYEQWRKENPANALTLDRIRKGQLPKDWELALPVFTEGDRIATRSASGKIINAIAEVIPELWGGSCDLAGSNKTYMNGYPSFFPEERSSHLFHGTYFGRNLHFGVREFAMACIMNGVAADGLSRIYGGTFFVFSDFERGALRLSSLMDLPVIHVWTHDSIGVGEDGPTHQPIEQLAACRILPNFAVVRPADAAETVQAWRAVLKQSHPAGIVLTRQNVINLKRGDGILASPEGLARGAYILSDCDGKPDVIIMASGSEVAVALDAQKILTSENLAVRVVSMPCMEWFENQNKEYRNSVLPPSVRARVSIEAGIALPWRKWVGDCGRCVSIERFGASAEGSLLFEEFGITAAHAVQAAHESLAELQELS